MVIAVAAVLAAACGPSSGKLAPVGAVSKNPRAERAFEHARALFLAGELEQADSAFATFALDFSGDPLARSAIVFRGRIALERGDAQRARVLLDPIASADTSDPVSERAAFYRGVALFLLDKPGRARDELEQFVDRLTDPDENRLLLDTLWRAARDSGDPARALVVLEKRIAADESDLEPREIERDLSDLTGRLTDPAAVEDLIDELRPGSRSWSAAMARLIELRFESGDLDGAAATLDDARSAGYGEDPAVEEVAELVEQRAAVDLGTVGCILPLSGKSRLAGEAVLKGVMLGSRVIRFGEDEHSLAVVTRDSAGDPSRAAAAVEELVLEDNVAAIVGPMDGEASLAAARKAEELGVPIVALTMREGVGAVGRNAFRLFTSNRAEVRTLVARARELGGTEFAVLYPDDGYGRAMRHTLRGVLADQGQLPVREVAYDPQQTGFVEQAEQVADEQFDVLFVPDVSSRLALVAPALAAAGLWSVRTGSQAPEDGRGVQLIAPSAAISADLVRRAGRYLDGALFATGHHADASSGAAEFAARFADEYDREPSYFEAFGHDAVLLVAAAIDDGARSRAGIRNWLVRADGELAAELGLAAPFEGFDEQGETTAGSWVLVLGDAGYEVLR
jgi:ABC-type branched-subunit amino acid transport system substrate-binding protein